ncbi:MAG: hypothetical protein OWS74_07455, partial [Firmicutes bacterium]|nr:hypothetical protein [Bacillota bacterium]
MQILQIEKEKPKLSQDVNFLASSVYETYDLRDKVGPGEKFIIRQGDLIISNYIIDYPRRRGLRYAHIETKNVN